MKMHSMIDKLKAIIEKIVAKIKNPHLINKRKKNANKIIFGVIRSVILFGLCFIILYPIVQQLLQAFRAPEDVNDPSIIWIPKIWSFKNFEIAVLLLDYWKALFNTFKISLLTMILQIASTAFAGYAFARLKFKGSNILFVLVILTIIIPPQALSLSHKIYFTQIGLLRKEESLYLMSGLGMGIRSGIFIYIFRSFFSGLPKELEESAQIDGAGVFRTFWNIMLPNARGALVTVGLFAFVWQWNDSYFVRVFEISTVDFPLLTMRLANAADNMYGALAITNALYLVGQDVWSNPVFLALISNVSALLMMLPLLIMYLFVQKGFVESIERTGIVG